MLRQPSPSCSMSDPRPIGVFDSGIGGLMVVKALHELLPNENIFYLGDTARVPYGGKSAVTVERYSLEMTDMLADEDVKIIVIAHYLTQLGAEGMNTLVLGFTHYPLLNGAIARFLGDKVKLVDSAGNCARAVEELLNRQLLRAPAENSGVLEVALTDAPDSFLRVAREALKLEIDQVQLREVLHPSPR